MQLRLRTIVMSVACAASSSLFAAAVPHYGISVSTPLITKDPTHLRAYRFSIWGQPPALVWRQVHIYFDLSAGHWWVTNDTRYRSLNIYAFAPVLRYYFQVNPNFSPFMNLSIGLSYLTRTKIDDRNLGVHFAFQDQIGLGATIGKEQKVSVTFTALHYSNGSMCGYNAGITVPVMMGIDFGFG